MIADQEKYAAFKQQAERKQAFYNKVQMLVDKHFGKVSDTQLLKLIEFADELTLHGEEALEQLPNAFEVTEVAFKVSDKSHTFRIVHNTREYLTSIESAFENWVHRTDQHTEQGFCDYMKSKIPDMFAMPFGEFEKKFPEWKELSTDIDDEEQQNDVSSEIPS